MTETVEQLFVLLDADIAGCAQVVLRHGTLDSKRAADLERMLPLLTDPHEVAYASGLRELAAAVHHADRSRSL